MKRRHFLFSSALGFSVLPLGGFSMGGRGFRDPGPTGTGKVKTALLAMQRASWEQGVAAQAFLESGEEELTILMAADSVLRQNNEGQLSVLYQENGVTDPAAAGQAVLFAWEKTGEVKFKNAADRMLDYLVNRAPRTDGIIHHIKTKPEIWIDSMYMAPPFLAAAGRHEEAIRQIRGWKSFLWNEHDHLFSHIYDLEQKKFVREAYWGVGNGWAAAGMARVIDLLPPEFHDARQELIDTEKALIGSCLTYMRSDGFFHNVINDPGTFVETNLSQMLAYTIFSGIASGWLPKGWKEKATHMRTAANGKVDRMGLVHDVCGAPYFDSPGTAPEGQAFFILMEALAGKAGLEDFPTENPKPISSST